MSNPQPPKLLTRFFRWFCREDLVDAIEGDLLELYQRRVETHSPLRASLLYFWNVLTFFQPFAIKRKNHPLNLLYQFDMLGNYFKMAFRTLKASKAFTFINIFGLALGMTACILILAFVNLELSYDQFHSKKDRIYRLQYSYTARDAVTRVSRVPFPLKPHLIDKYPEIEHIARFYQNRIDKTTLGFEDKLYTEENIFFTDPEVFHVLDFELEQGDPETALSTTYSIVITRKAATKYFGDEDPMGKTLEYKGRDKLEVTGILKELPTNSHLQFDMLVPTELQRMRWIRQAENNGYDFEQDWKWSGAWTYILLREGTDFQNFAVNLKRDGKDWFGRLSNREVQYNYEAKPLREIYFDKDIVSKAGPSGNLVQIYALIAVAFLILLIAGINFVNLSTARSARRAKEVGLRKVMGAFRKQLITQFVSESVVICMIAALLALLMVHGLLPIFSDFVEKTVNIPYAQHPMIVLYGVLGVLFIGFLAGIYPAFYLSSYLPSRTLKGDFERQGKSHMGLRKMLVVGQFVVSNILVVGVLVIQGQLHFIKNKDLGFEKDQTIVLAHGNKIDDQYKLFEERAQQIPGVAIVGHGYVAGERGWVQSFRVNGEDSHEGKSLGHKMVGYNFVDMYDLDIAAGRYFRRSSPTDSASAILLNEAAVKVFGWTNDEALGQEFTYIGGNDNKTFFRMKVIGVLADANFESLYDPVRPSVFQFSPWGDIAIKYNAQTREELFAAIEETEKIWDSMTQRWPFEYSFLDQMIARQYQTDEMLGQLIKYFGILAILIACLGLFGLASFTVQKRTKEIGVRKVLGASVQRIFIMVARNFVVLIVVSIVLSGPIAYWLSSQWLQDFAYRIPLTPAFFIQAAAICLLISLLAVSSQTLRAAMLNPTDALKYE